MNLSASELLALIEDDGSIDIDLNRLDLEDTDENADMFDEPFVDPAQEAHDYELGPFGDARRCPRHPGVKTSSDDGMFDCECHLCEAEQDAAEQAWMFDPENDRRPYCRKETYITHPCYMRGLCEASKGDASSLSAVSCVPTEEDQIPF